jgi:transcription termination factor Rho
MAEELGVEGASTMRKQDLLFAILKVQAENGEQIMGEGTIEVLPDGFGFLRSPEANYLAGPRRHLCLAQPGPQIRPAHRRYGRRRDPRPKDGERYFALTKLTRSISTIPRRSATASISTI